MTFANVVSVIALFVALGGTAAASVIITSNSQVAPGTISGHHPPSGDRANIIPGSVNQSDLANGSVNSFKVLDHSLTTHDLAGTDVNGTISIAAVPARTCGTLNLSIGGAQPGDLVLLSFEGDVELPDRLLVEPLKVSSANTVTGRVCNPTSTVSAAVSNLGVRVLTLR